MPRLRGLAGRSFIRSHGSERSSSRCCGMAWFLRPTTLAIPMPRRHDRHADCTADERALLSPETEGRQIMEPQYTNRERRRSNTIVFFAIVFAAALVLFVMIITGWGPLPMLAVL